MKNLYSPVGILFLVFGCFVAPSDAFQDEKAEVPGRFGTAEQNQRTNNGKISFTFKDQDWEDVIPWFADQAGYSLQPISDWPQGVFTLKDKEEYTVLEALDQLNHALRRLNPEPFTLIRNRKMLILAKLSDANFPDELIEVVKVSDLDNRGKYETIRCVFDLGDLNGEELYDQIIPLIADRNREFYTVIPAANQIRIRESGGQLREIRDVIEVARERVAAEETDLIVYTLKHQDSESFMMIARGLLGMAAGNNVRDDNELAIAVEPFGDRLFVQGTKNWLGRFEQIAAKVDLSADDIEGVAEVDELTLKNYSVLTDAKQAFLTVETMLEGSEGVRMGQDELTGSITILGRKLDHEMTQNTLDTLSGAGANGFALIQLQNADPVDVIMALQSLFRQSAEDDSGPVMLGDSDKNQIIVKGTPQEVNQVKLMVAQIDENAVPTISGSRSDHRIIPMDDREQERLMPMLEDLLDATGRKNQLNIVMPEDRKDFRNRFRSNVPATEEPEFEIPAGLSPEQQQMLEDLRKSGQTSPGNSNSTLHKNSQLKSIADDLFLIAASQLNLGVNLSLLTSCTVPFQEEEIGQSSAESSRLRDSTSGYTPPEKVISVPNSPVEVKFTEYGIVLMSKDLDALDDLEYIIGQQFDSESVSQAPFFFFLKHRGADEILGFLETYYGIADSGGGGGGGNMMGNMLGNMMGGGDLLGGLMGGGLDGGSDSGTLEGDVSFGVDMKFNSLYVRGATNGDLDEINTLIEMLDQPEAPHNPDLMGQFRTIDVIHRDPNELKDIILEQLADLIDSGEQGGANKPNAEMAQMAKMVQSLSGKSKGTNTQDLAEKRPKVKLSVDESTSQILVTGPEYIYKKILEMVIKLDNPDLSVPPSSEMLKPLNSKIIKSILKARFGDKLEIIIGDGSTENASGGAKTAGGRTSASGANSTDAKKAQTQSDAVRNAIFSQLRASQAKQGGGATSGRGGGATRGGGGTRGGRGGR